MNQKTEPLVSVITPFFNTEKYISECIESVLTQTYTNWEYILLNNCSTDRSLQIAQGYADREPRIRLISNDSFLGQVQNYNRALCLMSPKSKYCKIVQADDWIFPECLIEMVNVAESHPTVGVVGSYWLRGNDLMGGGLPYPSTFMTGIDVGKWQLLNHPDKHILTQPTAHLIRSDLIRAQDPFYDEDIKDYEDYDVWFRVLQTSDFGFVHKVLTFQRVDAGSISGEIRNYFPHLLSSFICLKKYGMSYLSENEYIERYRYISDRYFIALAKTCLFEKYAREVWNYHNNVLNGSGCSIKKLVIAGYVLRELLELLRHPKLLNKILRRIFG